MKNGLWEVCARHSSVEILPAQYEAIREKAKEFARWSRDELASLATVKDPGRILGGLDVLTGDLAFEPAEHQIVHPFALPDLSADRYVNPDHPFIKAIESGTELLRAEYLALKANDHTPFQTTKTGTPYLTGDWDAFYFCRYGNVSEEASEKCPRSHAHITKVAEDHGVALHLQRGQSLFSVLRPGSVIGRHSDHDNCTMNFLLAVQFRPRRGSTLLLAEKLAPSKMVAATDFRTRTSTRFTTPATSLELFYCWKCFIRT